MQSIINFFTGNVEVEIHGAYPERFLNLCARNGIGFWDMSCPAIGELRVRMTVKDYRRIRPVAKKSMCRIHIVGKRGVPFFTKRFSKRAALISGALVFCIIAWILTSFVWIIDIDGFPQLDTVKLREYLRENGVYYGAHASAVDLDTLKNDILIRMPELSYITVNFSGSHAEVRARARTMPPEVVPMDEPCDIVAARGGIITDIVVKSGMAQAVRGDTVTEGQLLASGYVTGRAGSTVVTHAIAEVVARTWRTVTSKMPREIQLKSSTGAEKRLRTLIVFGRRIKLYFNSGISYAKCGKIVSRTVLTLPGGTKLPVALETAVLSEFTTETAQIPVETAYEYLSRGLERSLALPEDGQLLSASYTASSDRDTASVTMVAECVEPIGKERPLLKDG